MEIRNFGPPRDRRRRRRILTRKNILGVVLAALVIFAAVSLLSELRSPGDGFGRLYEKRTASERVDLAEPVRELEPVHEVPIDPYLIRRPSLGVDRDRPSAVEPASVIDAPQGKLGHTDPSPTLRSRYVISGGPEGVSVRPK